jgi:hypothetical protein
VFDSREVATGSGTPLNFAQGGGDQWVNCRPLPFAHPSWLQSFLKSFLQPSFKEAFKWILHFFWTSVEDVTEEEAPCTTASATAAKINSIPSASASRPTPPADNSYKDMAAEAARMMSQNPGAAGVVLQVCLFKISHVSWERKHAHQLPFWNPE